MTLILPILAAIAQAVGLIVSKTGLTRHKISVRDYIPGLFLFLALFSGLSLIKLGGLNLASFSAHDMILLLLASLAAAIWNMLYYVGLSKEKANVSESVVVLMPLATILMSWMFKPGNFSVLVAIIAAVATLTLVINSRSHNLFRYGRSGLIFGIAVVLMALENNLVSQLLLLGNVSPATIYFIRTVIVLAIFLVYYRPAFKRFKPRTFGLLAISGLIGTATMLLRFYSLRDVGVTTTALILILVPIIVLILASVFLHEKVKSDRAILIIIMGAMVVSAAYINYLY